MSFHSVLDNKMGEKWKDHILFSFFIRCYLINLKIFFYVNDDDINSIEKNNNYLLFTVKKHKPNFYYVHKFLLRFLENLKNWKLETSDEELSDDGEPV